MAFNQIISLALCLIAFIILCIVIYLRMFPDKWYLYRIVCHINIWTIETEVWLRLKIPTGLSKPELRTLLLNQLDEDFHQIEKIKLIGLKRCKRGEEP